MYLTISGLLSLIAALINLIPIVYGIPFSLNICKAAPGVKFTFNIAFITVMVIGSFTLINFIFTGIIAHFTLYQCKNFVRQLGVKDKDMTVDYMEFSEDDPVFRRLHENMEYFVAHNQISARAK